MRSPANTAAASSAIGFFIADLGIVFTVTVIPVAKTAILWLWDTRDVVSAAGLRELDGQVADVKQRAHEGYGNSRNTADLHFFGRDSNKRSLTSVALLQSSFRQHLEKLLLRPHIDRLRY